MTASRIAYTLVAFTVLVVILGATITFASDASENESNDETITFAQDGISYKITDESSVTLTSYDDSEYRKCHPETPGTVTVPDTVNYEGKMYNIVAIADSAITNLKFTEEVVIGNNVKTIGQYNFCAMPQLITVIFGKSVCEVSSYIFYNCPILRTITVSEGSTLSFDGNGALYETSTHSLIRLLESFSGVFTADSSTSAISTSACANCTGLTKVVLPQSLIIISDYAFEDCTALVHVSTSETEDALPAHVIYIGQEAFYNCYQLQTFQLGEEVSILGTYAFGHCTAITSVNLPNSITFIGEGAFIQCNSLEEITISEGNANYATLDGVLYQKIHGNDYATLVAYPMGKKITDGVFRVPDEVSGIGSFSFGGSGDLTEIVLPNSISYLDDTAFAYCYSLKAINIPEAITIIKPGLFLWCTSLERIDIQSALLKIGSGAFMHSGIKSIELPDTLKTIDSYSFANCENLTYIHLPASVESVGGYAFYNSGLTSIRIQSERTTFEHMSLAVVSGEGSVTRTLIIECHETLKIPDSAFSSNVTPQYNYFDKVNYPYENWIAIAFCVALMAFAAVKLRRV